MSLLFVKRLPKNDLMKYNVTKKPSVLDKPKVIYLLNIIYL